MGGNAALFGVVTLLPVVIGGGSVQGDQPHFTHILWIKYTLVAPGIGGVILGPMLKAMCTSGVQTALSPFTAVV